MKTSYRTVWAALCSIWATTGWSQDMRPNIIYIMCDDMGYGDLGCYGQKHIDTPNLDRMSSEGMRFTNAYAGSPVSAPSRCSFMTGQHTGHCKVRGNKEYWTQSLRERMFGENSDYAIIGQEPYDMNHVILPEIMKQCGYKTGMFGKWAAGYYNVLEPEKSSESLPNNRGVDTYYGMLCQFQAHSYYPNFLNRFDPDKYGDEHVVVDTLKENILHKGVITGDEDYENRSQYSSELIHQYALDWLDRQEKGQPFFGIFTYTLPHAELWQPQDELVDKYKRRFNDDDVVFAGQFGSWYYKNQNSHAQFAAMIERLDRQVGEIRAKLREKGLDENTIIIFTSDNGPHEEGGADPDWFLNRDGGLRGHKRSCYEGGIRVPFIVLWPGYVEAGSVNDHQLAFYDVMPTLCDIVGTDLREYKRSEDDVFDGISFLPTLVGKDDDQQKHDHLYWEFNETQQLGVRQGDWKLVVINGKCHLYNLATDYHEDNDLADEMPEKVKELKEIIKKEHIHSDMFPIVLPE